MTRSSWIGFFASGNPIPKNSSVCAAVRRSAVFNPLFFPAMAITSSPALIAPASQAISVISMATFVPDPNR
ncbi:hypothetical protein KKB01_00170 [bacterium]|nr:hypothetical protein [bacterium]